MTRRYDSNDASQVAERQADAKRREEQRDADWRWLLDAPQGRRVMVELLHMAGLVEASFSESPLLMAKAEGARSVALYVHGRITQTAEGRHAPALMADLVMPPDVRRRARSNDRDDADTSG